MRRQAIENFRDDESEIEHNANSERRIVVRRRMRMIVVVRHLTKLGTSRGPARRLNSGALEKGAKDFLGFEELAGNFAGGERVAGVIRIDAFHGFSDFA